MYILSLHTELPPFYPPRAGADRFPGIDKHGIYHKQNTNFGDRAVSVLGLFVFQLGFFLTSTNRSQIPWPTVIIGLFLQQAIALFVLKSGAGFSMFSWIAFLARDFLAQSHAGAVFFFSQDVPRHQ